MGFPSGALAMLAHSLCTYVMLVNTESCIYPTWGVKGQLLKVPGGQLPLYYYYLGGYVDNQNNVTVCEGSGRLSPAKVFDAEVLGALEGLRTAVKIPDASDNPIVLCLDNLAALFLIYPHYL